jgi:Ricin-type beta-trefoil lectin domain
MDGGYEMRKVLAVMAILLASTVLMPTPAVAAPATGELRNGTGRVTGRGWSVCLDVPGGDSDSGTSVRLYPLCNGTEAQRFTMDVTATGVVRVLGKCLDVGGGATNSGARVQIWTCNGTGAQLWEPFYSPVATVPGIDFFLRNPQSGRCLMANDGGAVIEDCATSVNDARRHPMSFRLGAQIF